MGLFSRLFGQSSKPAESTALPGRRVLVVDASITITKVVELTLSDAEIATAGSIEEAKRAFANERPEVVLAAVVLPDGDGYQLCRAFAPVPVILLHGAFEPFDEARARMAGAKGIVKKPFQPAELLAAVRQALGA